MIAVLRARMPAGPLTSVGIGDDAAVIAAPSGSVVAAVDMLIEGRHFRREWSSAYDIGAKSAARSLADIAAMGAVNTALLVALATPGALPARWAAELGEGLAAEAARAGAGVVGGDTARADAVALSVTALGDLEGRRPVLRSGARPGDIIAVAGTLGHSAAGLALLTAGFRPDPARTPAAGQSPRPDAPLPDAPLPDAPVPDAPLPALLPESLAGLVTAHVRPAPPYDAGPEAARLGATAMIDVSDGLLADLGHVAAESAVRIDIKSSSLPVHTSLVEAAAWLPASQPPPGTNAACSPGTVPADPVAHPDVPASKPGGPAPEPGDEARWRVMALQWVLTGGEDHALVAAFPVATPLPGRWQVIGEVREGAGVTVDGTPHKGPGGWQHFSH